MNIFACHESAWQSAMNLDDLRKNKMILETAQILSTVMHFNGGGTPAVYKPTHVNHPCVRWARKSRGNFGWLVDYMEALGHQKKGNHKSLDLIPTFARFGADGKFGVEQRTPFVNCARNKSLNIDFTRVTNPHYAYKLYLSERWKKDKTPPTWGWGEKPSWA